MTAPEKRTLSDPDPRPRTRRARWAMVWSAAILALAGCVTAGVLLFVMERPMAAPDWLRDRVEARADEMWPAARVDLGTITFQLRRSLDVAVTIDNVAVASQGGEPLFDLARLDATMARRGLLRARLEAKTISAAGLFLTLDRGIDGRFDLALGDGLAQSAPDFRSLLSAVDIAMENPRLDGLRAVTLDAVTLEYRDRAAGRTWLIDGGRIQATRGPDAIGLRGDLALLSGGADVATLAVTATSPIGSRALALGVSLDNMPAGDIATQSAALAWLGVLRAPISGALRMAVDASGALAPLNATLQIGGGVLQPSEATRPIPFEAARTYFTFDPDAGRFEFTELSVTSDWLTATGTATAMLDVQDRTGLTGLTGQIAFDEMSGNPGGVFADGPRSLQALRADLHLALAPFFLRVGEVTARAGDLRVSGQAEVRAASEGWQVSALLQSPRAEPDQLLAYWPRKHATKSRDWISRNVLSGAFNNLQAHLRTTPGARPAVYLGAAIEAAEVRTLTGLPVISVAAGRLTLEDRLLVIAADAASVDPGRGGLIDASGTQFRILDTASRSGKAEVSVVTDGSLEATLALLDNPPLEIMRRAGRAVDLAEGRAVLRTELAFPLVPRVRAGQIAYLARGQILDLRSDQIVAGRVLLSDALDVTVDKESVRISGRGTLSDMPFDGTWQLPLSGPVETRQADLRAQIDLSEESLGAFGIDLPPGTLSGGGMGTLVVEFPPGARPSFSLSSTLEGLGIAIPPLGWNLSEAAQGRLAIAGALGPIPRIDRISLEGPRLQSEGRLVLTQEGGLEQAVLDRLRVGGWLDAAVTVTPRGPGRAPAIALRSGRLDIRDAPFGGVERRGSARGAQAQGGAGNAPVSLEAISLQVTDTLRLEDLRGTFTAEGGLDGRFTARVNGGALIEGRATPRGGRTGLDIRAEDAGDVLRDAGFFPDMVGGAFSLKLRPAPEPGAFDGALAIDRVNIRNAPAIAALLNAASIVGLLDELTGQGIYFEEIDAEFRLDRGDLTLTQSSAVGPSMGLSLDGYYDFTNRIMDFQGVVSPLYAVNILGRVIARRGEGLIGVSFTMQGPAAAPQVTVNPLSALTPGMFREIFRRPPPTLDE